MKCKADASNSARRWGIPVDGQEVWATHSLVAELSMSPSSLCLHLSLVPTSKITSSDTVKLCHGHIKWLCATITKQLLTDGNRGQGHVGRQHNIVKHAIHKVMNINCRPV